MKWKVNEKQIGWAVREDLHVGKAARSIKANTRVQGSFKIT